jgi:galactose mutarotase-like enzyme
MLHSIGNECLTLKVDSLGAQMTELSSCCENQFLWDGDPAYWNGRAPCLFPYVGRLTDNTYMLHGKKYSMGIHGFAWTSEFAVDEQREDFIRYRLSGNSDTGKQYPFDFDFYIQYKLEGWALEVTYAVKNHSMQMMPFGLGGHPGFRVPFSEGTKFSDYYLEFSDFCVPDRVIYSEDCYPIGKEKRLELEEGRILRLKHELFDDDAVVLKNMASEVTLKSHKTKSTVTVSYPNMPYLGLWHMPKTDAPYLCIEPWTSLSARKGVVEDLSCQSDLIRLAPGDEYKNKWRICIHDENADR